MRHRIVLALLALLETGSLLAGAAVAAAVANRPGESHPATASVRPALEHLTPAQPATAASPAPAAHRAQAAAAPRVQTPRPAPRPAARRTPPRVVVRPATLAPLALMQQAIGRIPGYQAGMATWTITPAFGHWGIADLGTGAIYISPSVPANRMYDVVAHEWSHVLSIKAYGGDVNAAMAGMNSYFGGSGLDGAEKAADCMALALGATWTHYTSCQNAAWQAGARQLLARQPL